MKDCRLVSSAVAANTLGTHINVASLRQKGVLYDLDPVYSPGRRRKKYAIMIISH